MDLRMDTSFEHWGEFGQTSAESSMTPGRLCYNPSNGVQLELSAHVARDEFLSHVARAGPVVHGMDQSNAPNPAFPRTIHGNLADGRAVTLVNCTNRCIRHGADTTGLPTTFRAESLLVGAHVEDLYELRLKSYTLELSSLASWAGMTPARIDYQSADGNDSGVAISLNRPAPLDIVLPSKSFDIRFSHVFETEPPFSDVQFRFRVRMGITIEAHDDIRLTELYAIADQCHKLMSLLIGHPLSVRSVAVKPLDFGLSSAGKSSLQWVYRQIGKHNHPDVHWSKVLLPHVDIGKEFPQIVERWFTRSDEKVWASNLFFGAELLESATIDVRFLALAQAAESYHRSLKPGDKLRKRLTELLNRLPDEVQCRIASNSSQFVAKVVHTRNHFTHGDSKSGKNALKGRDLLTACEQLRILMTANLLHDIGVKAERLLSVVQRSQEFGHWITVS